MPHDKNHAPLESAIRPPQKRLIKAFRGGLMIINPKLQCVSTSDLVAAVVQSFPIAFLDACSAQLKSTPMINSIASTGKWIFQVPSDGMLGGMSIEDCFQDLANRIAKSARVAAAKRAEPATDRETPKRTRVTNTQCSPLTADSVPLIQNPDSLHRCPEVSNTLLELMKERLVRRHGERTMRHTSPAAFVSAVMASFPSAFLVYCDTRLVEDKRPKHKRKSSSSSTNVPSSMSWIWTDSLFDDPPSETLGGKTVAECFRQLSERLTTKVSERVPQAVKDDAPERSAFVRQLYDIKDLHAFERKLPNGWRRDAVLKHIKLREDALALEKRKNAFRREIQDLTPTELKALSSQSGPEWKGRSIEERLIQISQEQTRQVQQFRIWLKGQSLSTLRSLESSFDLDWKNSETKQWLNEVEQREQERLRVEAQRRHDQEVNAFVESLAHKTVEELEHLRDSSCQQWMQDQIMKRLTDIRSRQHEMEVELLMSTLNNYVVRTLCEMAHLHSHGWQNKLICARIIDLLPKLGTDIIDRISKESSEGIQEVADWAKANIASRRRAQECAELRAELKGKTVDQLWRMITPSSAAWQKDEVIRYIEPQLSKADTMLLVRLSKLSTPELQEIAKLAKCELIRRKHEHESVIPAVVKRWV